MFVDYLKEEVLLKPAKDGGDELFIVSGYSSPATFDDHFEALREQRTDGVKINLIIGMKDSRSFLAQHRGYKKLLNEYNSYGFTRLATAPQPNNNFFQGQILSIRGILRTPSLFEE